MNYEVRSIDYQDCKEWFLKKHYAKRMPMISFCFGLYDKEKLIGVCSYGQTPSIQLNYSLSQNMFDVLELNRLVITENLPRNTLSYFVSKTLKQIPSPCVIVSFADTKYNHFGFIYQATNWIYTGFNADRSEWKMKSNPSLHYRNIAERYKGIDKSKIEELYKVKLSKKHRYVYFIGNKKQKKQMLSNLKYEIKPYPKGENKRYDASYQPTTQLKLL